MPLGPGARQQTQAGGGTAETQQDVDESQGDKQAAGDLAVRRIVGEPTVGSDQNYVYRDVRGTPVVRGQGDANAISPTDVLQGQVGDCWFLAAVIATAAVNPDALRRLIRPLGGGKYEVTLYTRDDQTKKKSKNLVTVNDDFPTFARTERGIDRQSGNWVTFQQGTPAYAHGGDVTADRHLEIWPLLLEKAMVMCRVPGYPTYDSGNAGPGWEGMDMLTPDEHMPEDLKLTLPPKSEVPTMRELRNPEHVPTVTLAEVLFTALQNKQPAVCGAAKTHGNDFTFCGEQRIMGMHVYAIVKVDPFAKTLDLQDPNGTTSGTVFIDDWKKTFGYCFIGQSTR
jgi:hypothetical protein